MESSPTKTRFSVTPRRWLDQCNPGLSNLISETLGLKKDVFLKDLYKLEVRPSSPSPFPFACTSTRAPR